MDDSDCSLSLYPVRLHLPVLADLIYVDIVMWEDKDTPFPFVRVR
jgi:hypothetical protein